MPPSASAAVSGVFRTLVIGTAVRQLRREVNDLDFSPADIRAFKELSKKSPKARCAPPCAPPFTLHPKILKLQHPNTLNP